MCTEPVFTRRHILKFQVTKQDQKSVSNLELLSKISPNIQKNIATESERKHIENQKQQDSTHCATPSSVEIIDDSFEPGRRSM